eukprot:349632-Chlamydomonas_euryale.AAC.51
MLTAASACCSSNRPRWGSPQLEMLAVVVSLSGQRRLLMKPSVACAIRSIATKATEWMHGAQLQRPLHCRRTDKKTDVKADRQLQGLCR